MERLRLEKEREDKEEADKMATMKIGDRQDMSHNSQIFNEYRTQSAKVVALPGEILLGVLPFKTPAADWWKTFNSQSGSTKRMVLEGNTESKTKVHHLKEQ